MRGQHLSTNISLPQGSPASSPVSLSLSLSTPSLALRCHESQKQLERARGVLAGWAAAAQTYGAILSLTDSVKAVEGTGPSAF